MRCWQMLREWAFCHSRHRYKEVGYIIKYTKIYIFGVFLKYDFNRCLTVQNQTPTAMRLINLVVIENVPYRCAFRVILQQLQTRLIHSELRMVYSELFSPLIAKKRWRNSIGKGAEEEEQCVPREDWCCTCSCDIKMPVSRKSKWWQQLIVSYCTTPASLRFFCKISTHILHSDPSAWILIVQ